MMGAKCTLVYCQEAHLYNLYVPFFNRAVQRPAAFLILSVDQRSAQQEIIHQICSAVGRCSHQSATPFCIRAIDVGAGPQESQRDLTVSAFHGTVQRRLPRAACQLIDVALGISFQECGHDSQAVPGIVTAQGRVWNVPSNG